LVEATKRIFIDYIIDGEIMLITAVLSLIFNLIMMDVLHQGPGHDHDHDHGDGHGHSHGHSHSHEEKADLGKSKSAIEAQKAVAAENSKNINVDAAYLHALSDMLLSIGVCIAALVIYIWPV
jgi:zinc transporter 2